MSIVGDALIRFGSFILRNWNVSLPWYSIFFDLERMTLDFLSGTLTVGIISPFFVRKTLATINKRKSWSMWGVSFGALAGFTNSVILAATHLLVLASRSEGQEMMPLALKLLSIYLPISAATTALPAAAVGALAGLATEIFLRRFLLAKR